MEQKQTEQTQSVESDPDKMMMELGSWLGRHQAFGMVANRCLAADAECLKAIRDSGSYKKLGLTWEEFCKQKAGVSRRQAERLISHLEEFGANYFRIADLIPMSADTYRLIAGSLVDGGIEYHGERIPLTLENREQLAAAVEAIRGDRVERVKPQPSADAIRRRVNALLDEVRSLTPGGGDRLVLIGVLDEAARKLSNASQHLRGDSPASA
jgi:hypothetical protein